MGNVKKKENDWDRELATALTQFHAEFATFTEQAQRLHALRTWAEKYLGGWAPNVLAKLRRRFNRSRAEHFSQLKQGLDSCVCVVCWGIPSHRHHIVELFQGGDNRPANWVWLCKPCHQRVHPWMRKRYGASNQAKWAKRRQRQKPKKQGAYRSIRRRQELDKQCSRLSRPERPKLIKKPVDCA